MSAVRIAELIDKSGIQLEERTIKIVLDLTVPQNGKRTILYRVGIIVQSPDHCGFNKELPCLFLSQIEDEV